MDDQPAAVAGPATGIDENGGEERARRRHRGDVRIFSKWCKGCGLCVAFCPERVFETDPNGRTVVAHPERCIACMWCYHHCPDFAIAVQRLDGDEGERVDHAG